MALDKQRILNELGNVMNQLQSADCGCMGKMFSNPTQCSSDKQPMGHTLPSYGNYQRTCHHAGHHSHNHNQAPCQTFPKNAQGMMSSCKGHFNPRQLYAETYNYLNENLMKPVMKEVYDELRSINPSNTVTTNPLAAQMGLNVSQVNTGVGGSISQPNEMSGTGHNMMKMSNLRQDQIEPNKMLHATNGFNPVNPQFMHAIGGMGPQIESMMKGIEKSKNIVPSSTPINPVSQQKGFTQNHYDISQMNLPYVKGLENNINHLANMDTKDISQNSTVVGQNQMQAHGINMNNNYNSMAGSRPPIDNAQYMQSNVQHPIGANFTPDHVYGQHSQGMQKFKAVFPSLMQNDLGYDPMAIAIQMSHQNVPTSSVQPKSNVIMADGERNMQLSTVPLQNQPDYSYSLRNNVTLDDQLQGQPNSHHNATPLNQLQSQYNSHNNVTPLNQSQYSSHNNVTPINILQSQPNTHTNVTPMTPLNQLQPQQNLDQIKSLYQMPNVLSSISEQTVSPKEAEGLENLQSTYQIQQSPVTQLPLQPEPIYPVEGKVNQRQPSLIHTEFNTLGQPVENLPVSAYQTPVQRLPQTLSPQSSPIRYSSSKVKNTISKTSLMGMKSIGKTKSQLQHIYQQYKGQHLSQSAGRLQEGKGKLKSNPVIPIEQIGDSTANNNVDIKQSELIKESTGDTSSKPTGKLRNGLQDIVFSSRPISAAWTFHGQLTAPYSSSYRPYSSYARRYSRK